MLDLHLLDLFWVLFKAYRRPGQHLAPQLPLANDVVLRYFGIKVGFFFLDHFHAGQRLQDLGLTLWKNVRASG